MTSTRQRRRAVQLDLFSPVDEVGSLITDQNGVPRLLKSPGSVGSAELQNSEESEHLMCGQRFIETGNPWS